MQTLAFLLEDGTTIEFDFGPEANAESTFQALGNAWASDEHTIISFAYGGQWAMLRKTSILGITLTPAGTIH